MLQEAPYRTPPGFCDKPFYYIFDGVNNQITPLLTNGQNYLNQSILTDGDADFILRRVTGWTDLAAGQQTPYPPNGFNFKYPNTTRDYFSLPVYGSLDRDLNVMQGMADFLVVPEIVYPAGSAISFDLYNILVAGLTGGEGEAPANYGQVVFQGVKRYRGECPPDSGYAYYHKNFTYQKDILLNWTRFDNVITPTAISAPRTFVIPVQNFDFELLAISYEVGEVVGRVLFGFTLYDPITDRQWSNRGTSLMAMSMLDANIAGAGSWGAIIPSILYPVNTQIKFDIWSYNPDDSDPPTINLQFIGRRRMPC